MCLPPQILSFIQYQQFLRVCPKSNRVEWPHTAIEVEMEMLWLQMQLIFFLEGVLRRRKNKSKAGKTAWLRSWLFFICHLHTIQAFAYFYSIKFINIGRTLNTVIPPHHLFFFHLFLGHSGMSYWRESNSKSHPGRAATCADFGWAFLGWTFRSGLLLFKFLKALQKVNSDFLEGVIKICPVQWLV